MDRVARRGPLARVPGALKGGHFSEIVNILSQLKGEMPKTERGTIWAF